jgi:osmotically-inducible protein OsmY
MARGTTTTDDDLRLDVAAELSWDPKVGSEAIVVSADAGAVTLRGTVGSLREKLEAGKAAARVYGVTEVGNLLQVRMPADSGRDDTDLRGDVLDALMLDSLIPMTVDAKVRDGRVTLTGTANWHYQRDEAEFLTASVPGVVGIRNEIALTSAPDGGDVKRDIIRALRRSAVPRARELSVRTASYGRVILAGTVNSWAEHREAVAAAWSAPGVTEVDDQIMVGTQPRSTGQLGVFSGAST